MKENNEKISTYATEQFATKAELNQEGRIRSDNDNALRQTIQDLSDDYEEFKESGGGGGVSKAYVDQQDALKQNITDNTLTTTNKTIVGGINELVTTKQNITDNTLTTTNKTVPGAINELVTNKADKTYVDTGLSGKQNTLTSGTNIKTINSQSLLGSGNIDISGGGSTPLDDNIEIYDNASNNFVAYKMDPLDWTQANNKSLTSKSYVDTQDTAITNTLNLKADKTYVDQQDATKQNITDNTLTTTNKTIVGGINELVTTKANTTYVDSQDALKQNITVGSR